MFRTSLDETHQLDLRWLAYIVRECRTSAGPTTHTHPDLSISTCDSRRPHRLEFALAVVVACILPPTTTTSLSIPLRLAIPFVSRPPPSSVATHHVDRTGTIRPISQCNLQYRRYILQARCCVCFVVAICAIVASSMPATSVSLPSLPTLAQSTTADVLSSGCDPVSAAARCATCRRSATLRSLPALHLCHPLHFHRSSHSPYSACTIDNVVAAIALPTRTVQAVPRESRPTTATSRVASQTIGLSPLVLLHCVLRCGCL